MSDDKYKKPKWETPNIENWNDDLMMTNLTKTSLMSELIII